MDHYRLEVWGYLWQGNRACSYYTVSTGEALALADRTRKYGNADAARCAGDFASVLDYRVIEIRRYCTGNKTVETRKTLRGFRNGMTPARFRRITCEDQL